MDKGAEPFQSGEWPADTDFRQLRVQVKPRGAAKKIVLRQIAAHTKAVERTVSTAEARRPREPFCHIQRHPHR